MPNVTVSRYQPKSIPIFSTTAVLCGGLLLFATAAPQAVAQDYEFMGLGGLDPDFIVSEASDVSADGSTAVGYSSNAGFGEAMLWTEAGGMVGLGDLPGGIIQSFARGVSGDGSVVVGVGTTDIATSRAFRWTEADGMMSLGTLGALPGNITNSIAWGVSADGETVVGSTTSPDGFQAFRWTEADGMVGLGDLPGGTFFSQAQGVSNDGSVIVGSSRNAAGEVAFRWTQESGMIGLGDLPGGSENSFAAGISGDGSTIVGIGTSDAGQLPVRWTEATGMLALGDLPDGAAYGAANDASFDGSAIVGEFFFPGFGQGAFLWTEPEGIRFIQDLLENDGVDLTGWSLHAATGISDDGEVIVGTGRNMANPSYLNGATEAWIARLGSGLVFPADLMRSARTLPEAAAAMEYGGHAASAALLDIGINHGCGERARAGSERVYCIYGAGDGRLFVDDPMDGGVGATSVGVLVGGSDSLRFGGGPVFLIGDTDLGGGGSTDFWGVGGGVFVGYGDFAAGPQAYASTAAYYLDADIERSYMNGSGRDRSKGSPDGYGVSAEAQAGYRFAAAEGVAVTPFANFQLSHISLGDYRESGGGFPAEFEGFDSTRTSLRLGIEGRVRASETAQVIATAAWGTGLSSSGDDAEGRVIGLMDIGARGSGKEDDWVEGSVGALVTSNGTQVSLSLGGSVGTDGDGGSIFGRIGISF